MRKLYYSCAVAFALLAMALVLDTQPANAAWNSFGGSVCDPNELECEDEIWFVENTNYEICQDGIRFQLATNFPYLQTTDGGVAVDQGFSNDILYNDGVHLVPLPNPISAEGTQLLSGADVRLAWETAPNLAEDVNVIVFGGSGGGDGGNNIGTQPISNCSISDTVPVSAAPRNLGADGRAFSEETFINFRFEHKGTQGATQTPAEWYRFLVQKDGAPFWDEWVRVRGGAENYCTGVVCSVPYPGPSQGLTNGEYRFWVQAYLGPNNQPWSSSPGYFRVGVEPSYPMPPITDVDPREGRPVISWDKYGSVEVNPGEFVGYEYTSVLWYQIYIGKPGEYVGYNAWVSADDVTCEEDFNGVCSYAPEVNLLEAGTYQVWMRNWNSGGFSSPDGANTNDSWVRGPDLILPTQAPALPTNVDVVNTQSSTPQLEWTYSPRATFYRAYVQHDNGYLNTGWQLGYDLGCGDGGTCQTDSLTGGDYSFGQTYKIYVEAWGPSGFSEGGPLPAPNDKYAESEFVFDASTLASD